MNEMFKRLAELILVVLIIFEVMFAYQLLKIFEHFIGNGYYSGFTMFKLTVFLVTGALVLFEVLIYLGICVLPERTKQYIIASEDNEIELLNEKTD